MTQPPGGPSNPPPPPPGGPGRGKVDQLLTVSEAASVIRCSTKTVYRLVWAGTLPSVDIGTGKKARTRIKVVDLQRYIESRVAA